MARIHIAQIDYRPAYYDSPTNFLEEPGHDETHTLGRLRRFPEINDLLRTSAEGYHRIITAKVESILRFSKSRGANILIFPEYSIPLELLPGIFQKSTEYDLAVVAGTHRVSINEATIKIYESARMSVSTEDAGVAICPILIPGKGSQQVVKLTRSKWEGSLTIPKSTPRAKIDLDVRGQDVALFVLICIDALHPDQLAQINAASSLVVCPSLSPSTTEFEGSATLVSLASSLFAYANCARYGGSQFHIPPKWRGQLRGKRSPLSTLGPGTEGIIETDVDLENLAGKQGSLDPGRDISHPFCVPIINVSGANWIRDYGHYRDEAVKALKSGNPVDAAEWLDIVNTEPSITNEILRANCSAIRHGIVPMFDGDVEFVSSLMAVVAIDGKSVADISRETAAQAIEYLSERIKTIQPTEMDDVFAVVKALKALPDVMTAKSEKALSQAPTVFTPRFQGDEDLDRRFQDRGGILDEMRMTFSNQDVRVVYVTGAFGVGKSALVRIVFRKQLADWTVIDIPIPRGGKVPRLLGEIAHKLGSDIDADALASASQKVFRSRVRGILERFFREPKRALIIDDLNSILVDATARDVNHLKMLFDEALSLSSIAGGKIVVLSSRYIPRVWTTHKGAKEIRLSGLGDKYISRVLEYDARHSGKVEGETFPPPRQDVLELVHGNPLIAKLLVQVDGMTLRARPKAGQMPGAANLVRTLAASILSEMRLSAADERILRQIAVFRLPIRLVTLAKLPGSSDLAVELKRLAERSVVAFDGGSIEMHEVVRRYFLSSIDRNEMARHNQMAVGYYKKSYDLMKSSGQYEPAIAAEYVYHLGLSGMTADLQSIQVLAEELKLAARQVYRIQKQYDLALRIYQTLHELRPDDLDVLAYIGRCFGRRQQWVDCENAFRQAIEIAQTMCRDYGWLYRDWGHILARYERYDDAKGALSRAESLNPEDASIVATRAYIAWREGEVQLAEDLFERALAINPSHTYSLKYYSLMLSDLGQLEYSKELRRRLEALEEGTSNDLFMLDELDDEDEI